MKGRRGAHWARPPHAAAPTRLVRSHDPRLRAECRVEAPAQSGARASDRRSPPISEATLVWGGSVGDAGSRREPRARTAAVMQRRLREWLALRSLSGSFPRSMAASGGHPLGGDKPGHWPLWMVHTAVADFAQLAELAPPVPKPGISMLSGPSKFDNAVATFSGLIAPVATAAGAHSRSVAATMSRPHKVLI